MKCIESGRGGQYYPLHLPALGECPPPCWKERKYVVQHIVVERHDAMGTKCMKLNMAEES